MNCEELDSHDTQTSFYNNFNLYSQFSPPKDENKINLIETNNSTPSCNNEKNLRYSLKYPDSRLLSESKKNKFSDMKKNVCDRLMTRIINLRRERMDNILYLKPSIIEKCRNEYYEVRFYLIKRIFAFTAIKN